MVYDGAAGEKYQNNKILYLWTCHFVKFENKRSLKLYKLHLPKEIS